jgi:quinol monooxygenase YgiN
MGFGVVAFHYPKPERRDELVQRMRAAAEVMRMVEGCVEALVWEVREGEALVFGGRGKSQELRLT